MKNKILALFVCLSMLGTGSLQAQRTMTGAEAATQLGNTGLIDEPNGLTINGDVVIRNSADVARTFTITATNGDVIINGNVTLTGNNGDVNGNTLPLRHGKPGHNLVINAGGAVNIPAGVTISTQGGNGVARTASYEVAHATGGNAGAAGNITINGEIVSILGHIVADGGNGGANSQYFLESVVGTGGAAGAISITANKNVAVNTIAATGGAAGRYMSGEANAYHIVVSKEGGNVTITSNEGSVTASGSITANGGAGTSQPVGNLVNNRIRVGSDGGVGGTVTIVSCGDISLSMIEANGGNAISLVDINSSGAEIQGGAGGVGGQVKLTSSNGNVSVQTIAANGNNGADVGGAVNALCHAPYDGRANHGGWGGSGGEIEIKTPQGEITINTRIEVNGGKGGNGISPTACAGTGGNAGIITGVYATGTLDDNKIFLTGGGRGNQTIGAGDDCQCVGQSQGNKSHSITQQNYTQPTLTGKIEIECDEDTNEVKAGQQITEVMLEALLNDPNTITVQGRRWEYSNDGGVNWKDLSILLPLTITESNKEEFSAYVRLVYTECGVEKSVQQVLIDIPCAPIPPPPPPVEEDCPELPNAIIWGGSGINSSFLLGDDEIEKLIIFNRFGVTVFEGKNGQGWDGMHKGKAVDPGNYFYVLEHECLGQVKGVIRVVKPD